MTPRIGGRGRARGWQADAERGVVLALVLILALLLSASVITFTRRAVLDTMIVRNREDAAAAEALARGGLRLATALLVEDRFTKNLQSSDVEHVREASSGNTADDLWHRVKDLELANEDGGRLTIEIRDAGGRLNLNAIVPYTGDDAPPNQDAEEFLVDFLDLVIGGMEIPPGDRVYDPRELARNFIDYTDGDEFRIAGGAEDDYYLAQDPPYRAANRPLLSISELGMIEGFDVQLVEEIRPYVTVYPVVGGTGINLNTAPPHVLGLVYHGTAGSRRLANEGLVRRLLDLRAQNLVVCSRAGGENCVGLSEVGLDEGSVFPAASLPDDSDAFTVISRGTVGEIVRTLVAVVDRSELSEPQLLFWRMR